MQFSWMCLGNSSQYFYTRFIPRKGSRPCFCRTQSHSSQFLLLFRLSVANFGTLWLGKEKKSTQLKASAQWLGSREDGEKRALSRLAAFISAFSFFFFLLLFFWFTVAWSYRSATGWRERRWESSGEVWGVTEASFLCTISACFGRALSHPPWINLTNLFYLTI